MPEESFGDAIFFVTFTDEAINYRYVYLIKYKSDVFGKFREYMRAVANQFEATLKVLRSDNGREYCNSNLQEYMKEKGIKF